MISILAMAAAAAWVLMQHPAATDPFAEVVPVAAWTVKFTAFEPAVPLAPIGDTTSQEGRAAGVITPTETVPGMIVNGVPRLAAEVTETTLGVPGT